MSATLNLVKKADKVKIGWRKFRIAEVVSFLKAAELLRLQNMDALYRMGHAALHHEALNMQGYPAEHSWCDKDDSRKRDVAYALVNEFYAMSVRNFGDMVKMLRKEGIISSFEFDNPDHKQELMELFERFPDKLPEKAA